MPKTPERRSGKKKPFSVLDHTADIGLRVHGQDLKTLFQNAGEGFFSLITDLRRVRPNVEKRIRIGAEPLERLMVDWLSDLLYLHEVENLLFKTFDVQTVGKEGLIATVKGEPFHEGRHVIKTEVKAVTHHQIKVKREKEGWRAQIIFDL